ncbi:MAG: replicative DNA helicase [Negativicoccus succinicivorans]|nr:replicative DNA helicase [Negativicoccus succinicivorans]
MIERIPPQNVDAELSVLGAAVTNKEAAIKATDVLQAADFYREANAVVFEAINNLIFHNQNVDVLTVTEELRRMGQLDNVGGVSYVTDLPNHLVSSLDVERHAQIVLEKARLRRLILAADTIAGEAYAGEGEVTDIVDAAERRILEVAKDERRQEMTAIGEIVQGQLDDIANKYTNKSGITGLPTGFSGFDNITSGLQPSDLILVAARPSMGKTALTLNIAQHVALKENKNVAFFSLEMSQEQLGLRMICSTALVDSQKLRTGRITSQDEWSRIMQAATALYDAPLFIDDTPGITVAEMRSKARRLQAEKGLDLIIVDYLQLMQGSQGRRQAENRQQEISEISRSLKSLARELKVPVIALSQLSRSVESRQVKRPMLSDLRESGSLEQDADIVAFLYREGYYQQEIEDSSKNITEVIIAKHRNGATGTIQLYFHGQWTRFVDMTNRNDEAEAQ